MKVTFRDQQLAQIRAIPPPDLGLPSGVVQAVRERLLLLEAAPDERTLRNWKALGYQINQESRDGQRSIRVDDEYSVVFVLEDGNPPVANISAINCAR